MTCRLHHHVWQVAQESTDDGQDGLPLDFGGIAHMASVCVHCGDVGKRWREPDLRLARAQAAASELSHRERCRNRALAGAAGRWVGAGERLR